MKEKFKSGFDNVVLFGYANESIYRHNPNNWETCHKDFTSLQSYFNELKTMLSVFEFVRELSTDATGKVMATREYRN